jgi:hypothetical protein
MVAMEAVLAHLTDYWVAYAAGFVCLLPLLYVTRSYSVPIIFYTVEMLIYMGIMHVVMWVIVVTARWFKEQSSMKALGDPERAPEWQTPLLEFWQRAEYNPPFVFWVEVVLVGVIIVGVYRLRPPKVKRKPKRRAAQERQQAVRAMNPRYRSGPGGGH